MNSLELFKKLVEVAKQNPQGFSFDITKGCFVIGGYLSASKQTTDCFGTSGLEKVLNHALSDQGGKIVGGWLDQKSNKYYFDSVYTFDCLDECIEFGKKNNQRAIFDNYRMKEIRLSNSK